MDNLSISERGPDDRLDGDLDGRANNDSSKGVGIAILTMELFIAAFGPLESDPQRSQLCPMSIHNLTVGNPIGRCIRSHHHKLRVSSRRHDVFADSKLGELFRAQHIGICCGPITPAPRLSTSSTLTVLPSHSIPIDSINLILERFDRSRASNPFPSSEKISFACTRPLESPIWRPYGAPHVNPPYQISRRVVLIP